jgi:hypothetical protein
VEITGRAAADIGLPGMPGTEGIRLLKAALSWPARAHAQSTARSGIFLLFRAYGITLPIGHQHT